MVDINPLSWWRRLLALPNSSPTKAIAVAALVALGCGIVVSVTAVTLRPLQQQHLERERQARMQALIASLPGMKELLAGADDVGVQTVLVDLATGGIVKDADPLAFDQRAAALDPSLNFTIPPAADIAGIGKRARRAPAYLLMREGKLARLILPVHGRGYQSMLYGYLALEGDLVTVAGLTFYEQAETPGMGTRIQEPAWLGQWPGKQIADQQGELRIEVVRGKSSSPHQIDGISGATRTGNGVTNLLRFWLGDLGFGPFLKSLASGSNLP
jgi:Na+-transporting NADH:ubiquinone oxidoreductase subunit C